MRHATRTPEQRHAAIDKATAEWKKNCRDRINQFVTKATKIDENRLTERSETSLITKETIDHEKHLVKASGMNLDYFRANPIVTWQHQYNLAPVGKCVYLKITADSIYATTHYPAKPPEWPDYIEWLPDRAWSAIKAGTLKGKSIGFIPTEIRPPTLEEIEKHGTDQFIVISKWTLLEYAVATLPVNPNALTQEPDK